MVDERFVGAWELVRTEARDGAGNVVDAVLPGRLGQIVYTASGRMSANLMSRERPPGVAGRVLEPEEKQRAYDDFVGYFGPYSVDAQAQVVTHHAIGALAPAMVNTDQPRAFTFSADGSELTLSPPPPEGADRRTYLIWRRVSG